MKDSDNFRLIKLLDDWGKYPSGKNFEKVMHELLNGNSFLMLPSNNTHVTGRKWTASEDEKLDLCCIYEVDGLKVIGVFTDDASFSRWSKRERTYVKMKTKDVLKLCEMNNIYKIVINSDSPNIFLARRSTEHLN